MPLKRFFGRGRNDTPPDVPDVPPEAEDAEDEQDQDAEALPEEAAVRSWLDRAESVLPTGASTGSKRVDVLYGAAGDDLPSHFASASGALITDVNGYQYLDCTMALGAVALGYAEPRVTRAVIDAVSQGNVSALSDHREVELAERLCAIIPCAERVQFLKSGAEATAKLIDKIPGTVFAAGDLAYPDGSDEQFAKCYGPTWGRFKDRTRPAVGNHEYHSDGASGYARYFGAAAGDPKKGYYSYDLGAWHIVVLNSECDQVGGCDAASPQGKWLQQDPKESPGRWQGMLPTDRWHRKRFLRERHLPPAIRCSNRASDRDHRLH